MDSSKSLMDQYMRPRLNRCRKIIEKLKLTEPSNIMYEALIARAERTLNEAIKMYKFKVEIEGSIETT